MRTTWLSPLNIGSVRLESRVIMAPMTRSRAEHETDAPTALNALYYAQRSGTGLIISEGTQVSLQGQGYACTSIIYSSEQRSGWKEVTHAVHEAGGLIAAQLWHVGRISHFSILGEGEAPIVHPPYEQRRKFSSRTAKVRK